MGPTTTRSSSAEGRDTSLAFIVGVAVLLTLAATLFASWAYGFTLNRVSLFALIFSIGILVDDAIVVVENIHRHRGLEPGAKLTSLIPKAVDEVGGPTILATLTVIAALLPMAFVTGLMGPYMSPIPINASMGMLISLAIAFSVTPWLSLKLLGKTHHAEAKSERLERLLRFEAQPHEVDEVVARLEDRADVVLDRELAEHRGFLRQVAEAEPRAAVHRSTAEFRPLSVTRTSGRPRVSSSSSRTSCVNEPFAEVRPPRMMSSMFWGSSPDFTALSTATCRSGEKTTGTAPTIIIGTTVETRPAAIPTMAADSPTRRVMVVNSMALRKATSVLPSGS